ncbi:MAG: sulfate ABC transporter ATP-binding protein [Geminicoccaceae bacterium]|nr:MAG: sulfate ABC transporter ATP-binding protein [Geminicoccaceae bacterium]
MQIDVQGVTRHFGTFAAVDDLDLAVPAGELTALLGPSGSGKTTLLRMIAGLDFPDRGRILFGGRDATDLGPRERRVGFVFQHYALFRHMTVAANVDFGLRVMPRQRRPAMAERRARVRRLLDLVQLGHLADRYPAQLSGGQRQRVALARALAIEPQVLLLDEPFGALDATVRKDLRRWLRLLHDEIHVTSLFVTHDQTEALEVADRVVVMHRGRIEQVGTPMALHDDPQSPFVYEFLGQANRFVCRVEQGRVRIGDALIEAERAGLAASVQGPGIAYVRPHELDLRASGTPGALAELTIRHLTAHGSGVRVELIDAAQPPGVYEAELPRAVFAERGFAPGSRVAVLPHRLRAFPTSPQP